MIGLSNHVSKIWVLHSSGKRWTVVTDDGEIIQRTDLLEAVDVLKQSVLAATSEMCPICRVPMRFVGQSEDGLFVGYSCTEDGVWWKLTVRGNE